LVDSILLNDGLNTVEVSDFLQVGVFGHVRFVPCV
jgi:hypothetical protein